MGNCACDTTPRSSKYSIIESKLKEIQ